jgi:hypothetical protein
MKQNTHLFSADIVCFDGMVLRDGKIQIYSHFERTWSLETSELKVFSEHGIIPGYA